MLTRDIYNSALCLLAESSVSGDNADYEERAPYILAVFCNDAIAADAAMRSFIGNTDEVTFDGIYVDLDDDFPLLERFAAIAATYLAAMLVLDDDAELSDKLYGKYLSSWTRLYDGIAGVQQSIRDKYFGR